MNLRKTIAVTLITWLVLNSLVGGNEDAAPARPESSAEVSSTNTNPADKSEIKSSSTGRLREGCKLVDQVGDFQKSGDHINFSFGKDGHGALRVLENLALERVARVLDDNPSLRVWCISGVITEYRGENYLLLTRATLKARTDNTPPLNGGPAPAKSE